MPSKDKEKQRATARAATARWRARHPDRVKAVKEKYRASAHGRAQELAYRLEYVAKNRDLINARNRERRRANPERHRRYSVNKGHEYRQRALLRIARAWGDSEPRCRFDSLPDGHPLKTVPCFGQLQIDHMVGGGNQEMKKRGNVMITVDIALGRRTISDLRILCMLHQLWNRGETPYKRVSITSEE